MRMIRDSNAAHDAMEESHDMEGGSPIIPLTPTTWRAQSLPRESIVIMLIEVASICLLMQVGRRSTKRDGMRSMQSSSRSLWGSLC